MGAISFGRLAVLQNVASNESLIFQRAISILQTYFDIYEKIKKCESCNYL